MKNKIILALIIFVSLFSSTYGSVSLSKGISIDGFNIIADIKMFLVLMCSWFVYELTMLLQRKGSELLSDR